MQKPRLSARLNKTVKESRKKNLYLPENMHWITESRSVFWRNRGKHREECFFLSSDFVYGPFFRCHNNLFRLFSGHMWLRSARNLSPPFVFHLIVLVFVESDEKRSRKMQGFRRVAPLDSAKGASGRMVTFEIGTCLLTRCEHSMM